MLYVLVAAAALALALFLYVPIERTGAAGVPLAVLRAAAWLLVALLLINPGCRRDDDAGPTVLLDASLSMTDPDGDARWRAALDSARALAGAEGRVLLFGDLPRPLGALARPGDVSSRLLPALRQAAAFGGPVTVVTDGEIDDAAALPTDLITSARVVLARGTERRDAAVAAIDLPAALRAGDTATAIVDLVAASASGADTVLLELLEQGRVAWRGRVALGAGAARRSVAFVPAPAPSLAERRRYEARLSQFDDDGDPRNDRLETAASVSSASSVVIISDSPDYDARWLASTVAATSGLPVRSYVRLGEGGWRDTRTLGAVGENVVREQAAGAAVLVLHGSARLQESLSRAGRGALLQWLPSSDAPGDWYVLTPEFASPVGGALAGIPVESLPPLESAREARGDSVKWSALTAQLNRRGRGVPVIQGGVRGGRRFVTVSGSGLWRWAARGGMALEGYRALMASLTDWLVETPGAALDPTLLALRDSLAGVSREYLPRQPVLQAQDGRRVAGASWALPLRYSPWFYLAAVLVLVVEWVARRRRGLR